MELELKDVVAISGQAGLHKIIGRTKSGLIVETIGGNRRFATGFQDKVSVLEDISMYTHDGDMKLAEVLVKLHEKGDVPAGKDDAKTQRAYLVDAIKLDSERVYDSDIRKLMNWYEHLKDVLDFSKLLESSSDENTEESEEHTETKTEKTATPKAPKNVAPKNISAKTNSKGSGAKSAYRPKAI